MEVGVGVGVAVGAGVGVGFGVDVGTGGVGGTGLATATGVAVGVGPASRGSASAKRAARVASAAGLGGSVGALGGVGMSVAAGARAEADLGVAEGGGADGVSPQAIASTLKPARAATSVRRLDRRNRDLERGPNGPAPPSAMGRPPALFGDNGSRGALHGCSNYRRLATVLLREARRYTGTR